MGSTILAVLSLLGPSPAAGPRAAPTSDVAAAPAEPTVALGDAIVVTRGATCLERNRLVAQVRAWTEREQIDARLVVEVTGDASDPRKLAFTLRRGDDVVAVRRFDPAPSRCSDIHSVVGLAIALAIDATLLESIHRDPPEVVPGDDPDPDPEPEPEPEPEPDPEPEPVPDRVPDPIVRKPDPPVVRPKRPQWRAWTEIVGIFSVGAPPGVGGGGRLEVLARWRDLVDIGAGAMIQSSGNERVGIGRALLWAAAGRVDACAGPRLGRLRVRGCTGLIAGAAFAVGQGFDIDSSSRVPWVAVPVGIRLEVFLARRAAIVFGAEGQGSVVRPTFEALDLALRRTSRSFARFSGALEAGLVLGLW